MIAITARSIILKISSSSLFCSIAPRAKIKETTYRTMVIKTRGVKILAITGAILLVNSGYGYSGLN